MNYPIWELPASGLLIALVAILHVFISHFAVGGGLFLVVTERKARIEGDRRLLDYVRFHSRFFVLLTLVLGAVTGVGIWFTIGLAHPQATSSLIQTWVWAWAIEWTLFASEIAAAMVYYYGWERLSPCIHMRVGWIYFIAAWLSLVVINGILTYMLTPGAWIVTRSFLDGFFNPTYWPALASRTFAAVGLAGLYALLTVAWSDDASLRAKVARYAGLGWVAPMAVAIPVSLVWYLAAASGAGVPVGAMFGNPAVGATGAIAALWSHADAGQPIVRLAAQVSLGASALCLVLTLVIVTVSHRVFARTLAAAVMATGLVALGGAEWVREGLRKPYVIGQFMLVNGIRLPAPEARPGRQHPAESPRPEDPLSIDALNQTGVLGASAWVRLPEAADPGVVDVDRLAAQGREIFKLECTACHTVDGHLAVRPLVRGRSAEALAGMLGRLATPVDPAGNPAPWNDPRLRLATWRGRFMPPFVGTDHEKRALAAFLSLVGGAPPESVKASLAVPAGADTGRAFFEENCSMCHGADGEWPMSERPSRSADVFFELLGRLPEVNEMMPPFPGDDGQRQAVATHLSRITAGKGVQEPSR